MRIKARSKNIFMVLVLMFCVVGVGVGQSTADTLVTNYPGSDDGMSGLIAVLFTLFLASTVNERVIEFVKFRFGILNFYSNY